MKSRTLMFWLAVLFLFSGSMFFWLISKRSGRSIDLHHAVAQEVSPDEVQELQDPDEPLEFVLVNQDDGEFDSTALKGKIWVGSVFFSTCPSTCRAQNMQIAKLQRKFGDRGVHFLSITCDPDKDTPKVMKDYASMFGAEHDKWHFLTGNYDDIEKIGTQKFGITVERQVHSDRLVVFDANGKSHGAFRSTDLNQFNELVEKLEELVSEHESTSEIPETSSEREEAKPASAEEAS